MSTPNQCLSAPQDYENLSEEEMNEKGEQLFEEIQSIMHNSMTQVIASGRGNESEACSTEAALAVRERLKQLSAEVAAITEARRKRRGAE